MPSEEVFRARKYTRVELRQKDGELACVVWVPPTKHPPDLLQWTDRLFMKESPTWYREASVHKVIFEDDTPPPVSDAG